MKVSELMQHLKAYVAQDPKHKDVMVMIKCNEGEAIATANKNAKKKSITEKRYGK